MSSTKRLLFGGGLKSEPFKSAWNARLDELSARLTVRIPTRRKNPLYGRRWDPHWPFCLTRAARDLGIETMHVNDGIFVATDADAERLKDRAQKIWDEHTARLRKASEKVVF